MASGNSTGPAITPPVVPGASVVARGSFASELDDDQINLHLMNNHVIQALVERYAESVATPQAIINNVRENVQADIASMQSASPEMARMTSDFQSSAMAERRDIENVQRINNARGSIADAEQIMEDEIHAELQRVSEAFYEIATKILNASNPTAQSIRDQIAQIDAEVAALEGELASLSEITQRHAGNPPTFTSGNTTRLDPLIQDLDASGVSPPTAYIDGGPGGPSYGTWQEYYDGQVFFNTSHRGLRAVENKVREIHARITQLADQYPSPYKDYQSLLAGNSLAERRTDWWAIAQTAAWIIAEEAAWVAAGVILAPITGGVATAIIVSARMARRAGAVGRFVAAGIGAGVNVARWFARMEDRIQSAAFRSFRNAWDRVRGRTPVRRGQPGGQVQGPGDAPTTRRCAGVVCVG